MPSLLQRRLLDKGIGELIVIEQRIFSKFLIKGALQPMEHGYAQTKAKTI